MYRAVFLVSALAGTVLQAQDVVFRSDVSLVRVDAQVVGRDNRAITGLHADDFVLREEGRPQPIRNFASEDMPVDVLLLIDVSGSMRPHVQRLADAAHQALAVLGPEDRVAMMVFDRASRTRMPFRGDRREVQRGFESLLNQESFNGGTDITRALLDAAEYVRRNARSDARRAVVILTDDQTERNRDEEAVERALRRADAVLSALLAPDAMSYRRRQSGGSWPGSGGGWPGQGGPLGGIILGRRGGGRYPGTINVGGNTRSAGTAQIARNSGGDSMSVDDAGAFENTLARIRQRYALHFHLPEGVRAGQERNIEVDLAASARRRYPDAEVRFRRTYQAPEGSSTPGSEPVVVSQAPPPETQADPDPDAPPRLRRRPAVDPVRVGEPGPTPSTAPPEPGTRRPSPDEPRWRREGEPDPAENSTAPNRGSWRRLKPGEQP